MNKIKSIVCSYFLLLVLNANGQSIGIENGLVSYHPILDGTVSDLSGNGNDGIIEGDPKFIKDRFGNKDGAISFNGKSDDFISKNSSSINTLGEKNGISISLWFKVDDWSSGGVFPVLMKSQNFSKNGFALKISSKGVSISDRKDALTFRFDIDKNKWYHLVGNYAQKDDQSMEWGFYLNNLGIMSPRNYLQSPDTSPVDLYFGKINIQLKNDAEVIYAKGAMDEIRVYNRVLTQEEIATLYNMGDRTSDLLKMPKQVRQETSIAPPSRTQVREQPKEETDKPIAISSTDVSHDDGIVERGIKNSKSAITTKVGNYYALIIGNNDYLDPSITPLDKPVSDATRLKETLVHNYNFTPENVTLLKDAKYEETIEVLDNFARTITPDDNFLMFYAGHGVWEEESRLGYWLPVDAKKSNKARWIGNSQLKDYLKSINSRHTLLIADACFGGSIFKTRAAFSDASQGINSLYEMPSKKAMTSGNLMTVPDESMFLKYLIKRLQDNQEPYLSADQLFQSFRIAVINNSSTDSPTTPLYGVIQGVGDEGGEFIFIKKRK